MTICPKTVISGSETSLTRSMLKPEIPKYIIAKRLPILVHRQPVYTGYPVYLYIASYLH